MTQQFCDIILNLYGGKVTYNEDDERGFKVVFSRQSQITYSKDISHIDDTTTKELHKLLDKAIKHVNHLLEKE